MYVSAFLVVRPPEVLCLPPSIVSKWRGLRELVVPNLAHRRAERGNLKPHGERVKRPYVQDVRFWGTRFLSTLKKTHGERVNPCGGIHFS